MNLIELLKGVWNRMVGPKTIESVLHITPTVSTQMKDAIELWESMYKDESPWLTENIKSLNLASLIASEKATTAVIEMEVKITGNDSTAEFMDKTFHKIRATIREELEYGIALGGFVIKPYVVMGPDNKYKIEFNYTKATDFYPLSFSPEGDIIEAAFLDRMVTKDVTYSKIEYHKLEGTTLRVINKAFRSENANLSTSLNGLDLGTPIPLTEVSAWASLQPEVEIANIDTLLFAYFKVPVANTVDLNSPLGASGFSRAVDLIKHADELYSDLLWEFEGGQLALDVDRTAFNPMRDANGRETVTLPKLQDRLYRRTLDLGADDMYNVFSPNLRDSNILNGLNSVLMRIEDVCAISRGTLSVVSTSEARTATELKILKQRSYAANADIQNELERTFKTVFNIIEKYCELYNIIPVGDYEVAYKWDDSIIVDKDAERQQDMLEVNSGLMSKLEYRMKWFGETETQAEDALKRIDDEAKAKMEMQQEMMMASGGGINGATNNQNNGAKSDKQAESDKLKRANESNETTKVGTAKKSD